MRPPQSLIESPTFVFERADDLFNAARGQIPSLELAEAARLLELSLPPITSRAMLSLMIGVNPGILWSFEHRPSKHYRVFTLKKGAGFRVIYAPKVALKVVQKWISFHLANRYAPADHVFGFVPGRSHLDAAATHLTAKWVFSVDIENFFSSTPLSLATSALERMGYRKETAQIVARLTCIGGYLAQGSPASPVISNMCLEEVDASLRNLALTHDIRVSRYADDIVFSGSGDYPQQLKSEIEGIFAGTPWKLSERKTSFHCLPNRLKVHGLLVQGEKLRLTKGYRNRIRALRHLMERGKISDASLRTVLGHLNYASQVDERRIP